MFGACNLLYVRCSFAWSGPGKARFLSHFGRCNLRHRKTGLARPLGQKGTVLGPVIALGHLPIPLVEEGRAHLEKTVPRLGGRRLRQRLRRSVNRMVAAAEHWAGLFGAMGGASGPVTYSKLLPFQGLRRD